MCPTAQCGLALVCNDLPWEASGSLYSISLCPRTSIHETDLKPTYSLGSRLAALPPGAEGPSLDQSNHSQPAEYKQENKWGVSYAAVLGQ